MRGRGGRILHDAGAVASFAGDPRQYGELDGGRAYGVGFDARNIQRAGWARGQSEDPAEPGAGDLRLHGRRVRLEVRPRGRGRAGRTVVQSGQSSGEADAAAV